MQTSNVGGWTAQSTVQPFITRVRDKVIVEIDLCLEQIKRGLRGNKSRLLVFLASSRSLVAD